MQYAAAELKADRELVMQGLAAAMAPEAVKAMTATVAIAVAMAPKAMKAMKARQAMKAMKVSKSDILRCGAVANLRRRQDVPPQIVEFD